MLNKKRVIKQIAFISACAAINAHAVAPGFYMGAAVGPATNNAQDETALTTSVPPARVVVTPRSQQFYSRIYMGNKINDYAGFEWGGSFYSAIHYNDKGQKTCASTDARVRDLEFLAVGYVPTASWPVDLFGKAGVAIAYSSTSGGLNCSFNTCGKTQYSNKFVPTFSIGAGYDWNQNWVTDITFTSLLLGGQIGNMTSISASLSYHFVNTYCGQFLCD